VTADRFRPFIDEFLANAGQLSGDYEGVPVLLLHTLDSTSGELHITPLTTQPLGNNNQGWAVFGSNSGRDADPAWYRSLLETSEVTIEFGPDTIPVTARVAAGAEREEIWSRQKRLMPSFAGYEESANRTIPVVVLEPR
jgi:deazaflavin-dependent oxidoreductase (nitroreductase family)